MNSPRAATAPNLAAAAPDDVLPDRAGAAPRRGRRWLAWALAAILALAALGGLGTVAAVYFARAEIGSRLTALGGERGLELSWSAIDLPLFEGATIRGLRVSSATDGRLLATLDAVETDVSLIAALTGRRRPDALVLRGVEAQVTVTDGRLVGFEGLRGDGDASDGEAAAPARPLRVEIAGGRVSVDVTEGGVAVERVELEGLAGAVARDAERRLVFEGTARVVAGGRETPASLHLTSDGDVALRFEEGLQVGAATPKGPVWLGLREVRRDPVAGRTELLGVGIQRGADRASATRITVMDHARGALPRPGELDEVSAEDVAVEHDGARVIAARVQISMGAPGADGWPVPREVRAAEVGVESTARDLKGTFGEATVTLTDPFGALRAGRPLDAIAGVTLARPRFVATVATAGGGAGADADGVDAVEGAGDAPPPAHDDGGIAALIQGLLSADQPKRAHAAAAKPDPKSDASGHAKQPKSKTNSVPQAPLATAHSGPGDGAEPGTATSRSRLVALLAYLRAWRLAVEDGVIDVHDTRGEPLLVLEGFGLSTREVGEGLLEISVRAEVQRNDERTGKVDADVGFDANGGVAYANGSISGKDLASQVSRFTSHVTVQPDAEIDLRFHYERPIDVGAPHRVRGQAHLSHFTFQYWRVADAEVKDLEANVSFDLALYPASHRLVLDLPEIAFGAARLSASLDATLEPGKRTRFAATLEMPEQDCGAVARSIPRALIPRLSTLAARGRMGFDARLTLDMANPYGLELRVTGDLDACTVSSLGPGINLEALKGRFVHVPVEPERGRLEGIRLGRGTSEWVSGADLPELVTAAAWITEDRRYFDHGGVRWDLIERALKMDLENERFIYGGSTVTQQLVKNLYLDRGKSLARKLEEAIIAWQMERVLTKDEILTIYVNVIEYGPEIYGVKHAARFYFGKRVDELDALEIAFIMGLKPYPANGYRQWQARALKPWWVTRLKKVLEMMAARSDELTAEEAAAFGPNYLPNFRPADASDVPRDRPSRPGEPGEPGEPDGAGGEAWDPWRP